MPSADHASDQKTVAETATHPFDTHRAQLAAILSAWGMPPANAEPTADILAWADLHGIDSHGLSMLPHYDAWRRGGRVRLDAEPVIERQTPVMALIDGGGGLGHVPARFAMRTAIEKAKISGMAIASVRNSSHFGACGYYTLMAAEAGLIGIACTSASGVRVAPTRGAKARFGTDPWSFAAPGEPGRPFLLDMATTTVAFGKVRNKANEKIPAPPGWVLTSDGHPSTDPLDAAERGGFLTSLGGAEENGSYKGYGLAAMVNILAACLSGSTLVTDPMHTRKPQGIDLGHFFMAIDPALFREPGAFQSDVARFTDDLRATPPVDPARPVLVAGDPERAVAARRRLEGVPVGLGLLAQIREIARQSNAEWMLV